MICKNKTSDDYKTDTYRSPDQDLSDTPAGFRVWNKNCDIKYHGSPIQGLNKKRAMKAFWELLK